MVRLLFLLSLSLVSLNVRALDVGKILFLQGAGVIIRDSAELQLEKMATLQVGDIIKTHAATRVQVKMIDNAILSIQSNSEFKILDYSDKTSKLKLIAGGFRTTTGDVAKNYQHAYMVLAPQAEFTVAGTFWGAYVAIDGLHVSIWEDLRTTRKNSKLIIKNNTGVFELGAGAQFNNAIVSSIDSKIKGVDVTTGYFERVIPEPKLNQEPELVQEPEIIPEPEVIQESEPLDIQVTQDAPKQDDTETKVEPEQHKAPEQPVEQKLESLDNIK